MLSLDLYIEIIERKLHNRLIDRNRKSKLLLYEF